MARGRRDMAQLDLFLAPNNLGTSPAHRPQAAIQAQACMGDQAATVPVRPLHRRRHTDSAQQPRVRSELETTQSRVGNSPPGPSGRLGGYPWPWPFRTSHHAHEQPGTRVPKDVAARHARPKVRYRRRAKVRSWRHLAVRCREPGAEPRSDPMGDRPVQGQIN